MAALVMKYVVVINSTVDLLLYNSYFIWKDKYLYDCVLYVSVTWPWWRVLPYVTLTGVPTVLIGWSTATTREQGIAFYAGELN